MTRRHPFQFRWALPLALLALLSVSGVKAEGTDRFELQTLPIGGRLTDVYVGDVDGDGRPDILAVQGREIRVHRQKKDGSYPRSPNQAWKLDRRAILFDVGDLEKDGRAELVFLTTEGVAVYRQNSEGAFSLRPEKILETTTILGASSAEEVRRKEFLVDVTGDGIEDLLLPVPEGFRVFEGEKGGFGRNWLLRVRPSAGLRLDSRGLQGRLRAWFWYPAVQVGLWNEDGEQDLFVQQEEKLYVFFGQKGEPPAPRPDRVLTVPAAKKRSGRLLDFDFTFPLHVLDLDGGGRSEILLSNLGKGQTAIFDAGTDLNDPRQVIRVPGLSLLQFPIDVDGDGDRDLIVLRSDEIGVMDILSILISRTVPIEVYTFLNRGPEKGFSDTPTAIRPIEIPIAFRSTKSRMQLGTQVVLSFFGDHTGDGRVDLLVREGSERLAVLPGGENGTFADSPAFHLAIPRTTEARFIEPRVFDLNADGVDDLLLLYQEFDPSRDRIAILRSTGR